MKNFLPFIIDDNSAKIDELGQNVDSVIFIIEQQVTQDGAYVHEKEFESYTEYAEFIEPLYDNIQEDIVTAAINYTSHFFYQKGLQDSVKIRNSLFKEGDRG